jgi:hypothetical protein
MYVTAEHAGSNCGELYSKRWCTTLGCCYSVGCARNTPINGGWSAGENVESTWALTMRHGGMHPTKLLHAVKAHVDARNLRLQAEARALTPNTATLDIIHSFNQYTPSGVRVTVTDTGLKTYVSPGSSVDIFGILC